MGRNFLTALSITAIMTIPTSAFAETVSSGNGVTPNVDTTEVKAFAAPTTKIGQSRLFRDKRGVRVEMVAADLDPGAIYTVWWVIFNDPNACTNGSGGQIAAGQLCDEADLFNPATNSGLIWGNGFQAGPAGTGSFTATLLEEDDGGDRPFAFLGLDKGLINAAKAEIHVVLRTHGAAGATGADIATQMSSYELGCGSCVDTHVAVHAAIPSGE